MQQNYVYAMSQYLEVKFKYFMQRKKSISQSKPCRKKSLPKKKQCNACTTNIGFTMLMQNALYRKYSSGHFSHLQAVQNLMNKPSSQNLQNESEHMEKFYKQVHRKHEFKKIKEIYKLHQEMPKIFMPEVIDIMNKCHQRKRLLDYFKIAKILGIRVETVKFSTFLLSLTKSQYNFNNQKKSFDRVLGQISQYEFSQDVERQLIDTLTSKKQRFTKNGICNPETLQIVHKNQQPTATSPVNYRHWQL